MLLRQAGKVGNCLHLLTPSHPPRHAISAWPISLIISISIDMPPKLLKLPERSPSFLSSLIVSLPPLVKEAFTGCSLKSSQLNRTGRDVADVPSILPPPCSLTVSFFWQKMEPEVGWMCFLQSTISIPGASRRIVYGGKTHANKKKKLFTEVDFEWGCREWEHVGELETNIKKDRAESPSVIIRRKDRGEWFLFPPPVFTQISKMLNA